MALENVWTDEANEGLGEIIEYLSLNVPITKDGYIYIYLSNESGKICEVYFDDFKITHEKLVPDLAHSTNTIAYRYGFQGQENDRETGYINYKYRMHDPRIGRFFAVDPLTAEYPFYSPYAFSGNRVIDSREIEGLEPSISRFLFHSMNFTTVNAEQVKRNTLNKMGKTARYGGMVMVIAGGVVTVVASGGTSTPAVVAAFGIVSGTYAVGAGTAKLILESTGQSDRASKIPDSYLNATVGVVLQSTVGDTEFTRIAEGVLTAKLLNIKPPKNSLELVDKVLTISNIVINLELPIKSSNGTNDNLKQKPNLEQVEVACETGCDDE